MYIGGTHTHTTIGPTIRTEIDVTVSQQIDNHVDTHPSNLTQEKNQWFATAVAKGDAQVLKLDFTGFSLQAEGAKIDVSGLAIAAYGGYFTLYGSTNSCFMNKFEVGLVGGKALGIEVKAIGIEGKSELLKSNLAALMNKVGLAQIEEGGVKMVEYPANIFGGILIGFNQFM
jgi:hypothetical protein